MSLRACRLLGCRHERTPGGPGAGKGAAPAGAWNKVGSRWLNEGGYTRWQCARCYVELRLR
ncbi:hypothetical protein SNL152K_8537 [Streptomyces sp. NL15-2K]|nr:hypothetical protein SNL152K_8537 [Streptomyces sp. NL15-2K]